MAVKMGNYPPVNQHTIWLFNSSPWKITIFKNGKPSISMGHLYHGYVSHNHIWTLNSSSVFEWKLSFQPPTHGMVDVSWRDGDRSDVCLTQKSHVMWTSSSMRIHRDHSNENNQLQ